MSVETDQALNDAYTARLHLETARRHALSRSYPAAIKSMCAGVARSMRQRGNAPPSTADLLEDTSKRRGKKERGVGTPIWREGSRWNAAAAEAGPR